MQMEETLGVKLFKRSKHRIILTDEGQLQEIIALADKAEKELAQGENTISGEIRSDAEKLKTWYICRR